MEPVNNIVKHSASILHSITTQPCLDGNHSRPKARQPVVWERSPFAAAAPVAPWPVWRLLGFVVSLELLQVVLLFWPKHNFASTAVSWKTPITIVVIEIGKTRFFWALDMQNVRWKETEIERCTPTKLFLSDHIHHSEKVIKKNKEKVMVLVAFYFYRSWQSNSGWWSFGNPFVGCNLQPSGCKRYPDPLPVAGSAIRLVIPPVTNVSAEVNRPSIRSTAGKTVKIGCSKWSFFSWLVAVLVSRSLCWNQKNFTQLLCQVLCKTWAWTMTRRALRKTIDSTFYIQYLSIL